MDTSTAGRTNLNEYLVTALHQCDEDDSDWVTQAQVALSQMERKCPPEEILGAAKLWLDRGYECIRNSGIKANPEAFQADKGNAMLRIAVDYLAAGGDTESVIRLAREQATVNMRLALRAWESVTDVHAFSNHERDEMLDLTERLKSLVKNPEDAKRICDAYARLGCKQEIVTFANDLERLGEHVIARHVRARADEMDQEHAVGSCT
jgi:hypothetical protein